MGGWGPRGAKSPWSLGAPGWKLFLQQERLMKTAECGMWNGLCRVGLGEEEFSAQSLESSRM